MAEDPVKPADEHPVQQADEPVTDLKQVGLGLFAVLLLFGTGVKVCGKPAHPDAPAIAAVPSSSIVPSEEAPASSAKDKVGLSAPIAAAYTKNGDVVVAGLDVPSKAIRVQRIDAKDAVVADRIVLDDVKWSTDADLKLAAGGDAVALTWHGLRENKLVRELVMLGSDLTKKLEPTEVSSAYCATKDAVWFANDTVATSRAWNGEKARFPLPKDKDSSLYCSARRAFGVIEEEDKTSILPLVHDAGTPVVMMKDGDFGEDDQRELSEYNIGDDVGVVRLALSGAIAIRETSDGGAGALHKLKSTVGADDDVVAVDATSKEIVIVYTQDVSSSCPKTEGNETPVSTRVQALRVDRATFEESTVELSPGRCGAEVGPFFTGPVGEDVSVAWVERGSGLGKARAPILGLAHVAVTLGGTPALARIDQVADAIVDAGCDGTHCFAAALVRRDDADAMSPGYVRVLRW
jgi:hypothetical protein